jgi:class 3 adenylate cyclase
MFTHCTRTQAKRSKGAPKASKTGERVRVSVVVTDVQGFTELTRRAPELTIKAMGGHNAIMRKGCHAHAGYVLEQEVRARALCVLGPLA